MQVGRLVGWSVVVLVSIVSGGWAQEPEAKSDAPPPAPNVADVAALVEAHNRERAKDQLPFLKSDPKLESAALVQARDMAEHNKMTHEGSDGSTAAQRIERANFHYRGAAENVAAGQRDVDEVMQAWLDSPPHKKNILGDFTEIGVACVKAKDGKPYWCVDFGKSWPVLDPKAAEAAVLDGFNEARAKAEKPRAKLKFESRLKAAAEHHAQAVASLGEYSAKDKEGKTPFQRLEESGYQFRRIGQLVSVGQPTPEDALKAWLEDEKNRETILGDYTEVGIGYAASEKEIPFWVILIAKPFDSSR
ncbi:CAP domain-containing protein [Singulisphaera sp. PoT]|uniref:CAP domain-containing protein n=1 Tax=Singulisphaera sp. PoT TaxID=3411797 RepID=UPI003BF4804C